MILGLTGSLGSGKSTVAEMIRELTGAVVIDADEITYQLQAPGGAAYGRIAEAFGPEIVKPDGTLDRKKLGAMVFADEAKRQVLNGIVHPLVRQEQLRHLDEHRSDPLVVLMVPLLFEAQMESLADRVVVVTVNEAARRERLWLRSAMQADEVERRLRTQMNQEEKARRADFLVDNSGALDATRQQVSELLRALGVSSRAGFSS
ncbi:MAG: dephospho-CoA kinase [Candidatus Sumerlaeaceae bacterium]